MALEYHFRSWFIFLRFEEFEKGSAVVFCFRLSDSQVLHLDPIWGEDWPDFSQWTHLALEDWLNFYTFSINKSRIDFFYA